ncbi:hypothetical protein [Humibacter ginsengiterrae]|jgi:hypothetical protein
MGRNRRSTGALLVIGTVGFYAAALLAFSLVAATGSLGLLWAVMPLALTALAFTVALELHARRRVQ